MSLLNSHIDKHHPQHMPQVIYLWDVQYKWALSKPTAPWEREFPSNSQASHCILSYQTTQKYIIAFRNYVVLWT